MEAQKIISIRSMLVYLLRAVFIVQPLLRRPWESGTGPRAQSCPPGTAAASQRASLPRLSRHLGGVPSRGFHPEPHAGSQDRGLVVGAQTPFEGLQPPRLCNEGRGGMGNCFLPPLWENPIFSFAVLPNVGSFSLSVLSTPARREA